MFFKKLELMGFKSFVKKTTIEFLPGITVIVGPNGCGKSNVFDAIRWVLGEQSAKSLRGQRMGDVIFNGSASYKALGYGQVSLTLCNEGKVLPIDFSEVNVTRRLYRTGESEYLLNKNACRLKDLIELFLDTGIGTNSYSILEQGKVDFIINAKPLERRYLFEEAVGIAKYKVKKEEALRKLARTQEDLLRLADIIAEVKSNSISLKRQATRAERYKELAEQQKGLEMRLLALRHRAMGEQKAELEHECEGIRVRLRETDAQIELVTAQSEAQRAETEALGKRIRETRTNEYEIASDMEKREGRVSVLQERLGHCEGRRGELRREIESLEEREVGLSKELERVACEKEGIKEHLFSLDARYSEECTLLEGVKARGAELRNRAEEIRSDLEKWSAEKIRQENEMQFAGVLRQNVLASIGEVEDGVAQCKSRLIALKEERKENEKQTAKLEAEQTKAKGEAKHLGGRISELRESLEETERRQQNTVSKMNDTSARLSVLEEMEEKLEGYERGVKEIMSQAEGGGLAGVREVLARTLEIPKEYEAAIEAALEQHLQGIVTEDVAAAQRAVEQLTERRCGRATFLALSIMHNGRGGEELRVVESESGVRGIAARVVGCPAWARVVLEALLCDTVIVDDLATALRLRERTHHLRYVTVRGEVVSAEGAIIGGEMTERGLLSRKREIRELAEHIGQLSSTRTTLENEIQEVETTREELLKEERELGQKVQELGFALDQKRLQRDELKRAYDEKLAQLSGMEKRLESLKKEIAEADRKAILAAKSLSLLEAKIEGLRQDASKNENELSHTIKETEERAARISELLVEITAAKERLKAHSEHRQRLEESLGTVQEQKARKRGDIGHLEGEHVHIEEEMVTLRESLVAIEKKKQEIEISLEKDEKENDLLSETLHEASEKMQLLQRERNELQNALHESELRGAQLTAQDEYLSNQSEEKFSLNLEELLERVGEVAEDKESLKAQLDDLRLQIDRIGAVNPHAIEEYEEVRKRYEFLVEQERDLQQARESLTQTIARIEEVTTQKFSEGFETIRAHFVEMFRRLFDGGKADLQLGDQELGLESGIDIVAQPPGKRLQHISLLSGGEKALTAIALLFGIFLYKPSPFCFLDEIDAPLDDANIERFKTVLKEFSETVQFVVITHNKRTMALADTAYGVTMEEPGVSKLVSVKLQGIEEMELVG